jgi:hypothetical protein
LWSRASTRTTCTLCWPRWGGGLDQPAVRWHRAGTSRVRTAVFDERPVRTARNCKHLHRTALNCTGCKHVRFPLLVAFVAARLGFGLICGALILHLRPGGPRQSAVTGPSVGNRIPVQAEDIDLRTTQPPCRKSSRGPM